MTKYLLTLLLMMTSLVVWAAPNSWNFKVYIDDKPIGYQRFTLSEQSGVREMAIEARFDAKFYGVFSYRYAHDATERWKNEVIDETKRHFDLTVETIHHDLLGADKDRLENHEDRIIRLEQRVEVAS